MQRSGDTVRITVKLIRAATDRNLWAQIYDGDMSRMFALQQQIASDVAVAAGRRRPTAPRAQTINPKAYEAYLNGLSARGLQRHEGFRRAVGYLEEAVAIQPDFAAAYAELAMVQVQFLFGGPYSPHQIIPKAEAAARKALQLDDNLPRAHRALGQILSLYYWRWEEGDKALERATILGGLDDSFSDQQLTDPAWTLPGGYRRGGARTQTRSTLGERTGDRRHRVSSRGRVRPCDQRIAPGAGDEPCRIIGSTFRLASPWWRWAAPLTRFGSSKLPHGRRRDTIPGSRPTWATPTLRPDVRRTLARC